ncbi:phospholipase [Citrobacter sp. R56]|uniref:phospholipase n=1 Tax=Citrobacter sp. R56 TaxID=1573676 RepID=UPI00193B8891|nr:phospholipase [Citrobacter sp. R56]QRG80034.1 phospholipase [Citrobacter sp. R56]
MYNIKFIYLFNENVSPALFAKIIRPSVAGQWIMSVPDNSLRSLFTRYDLLHSITGANPYQSGRNTRTLIVQDLDMGRVVAIDESHRNWSSVTEVFYINEKGRLQPASLTGLGWYPVSTIVDRYETMVRTYGSRPEPTVLPTQVVKAKTAQVPDQPTPGKEGKTYAAQLQEMTKAQRWQARKDLIAKGSNSLYPDAQIAAKRLAANNIAVEKAKLAGNVYKTVNPLEATPNVPEGWKDISNDSALLNKFGLKSKMLYDNETSPDFLARVYQPDPDVFGNDMNPTLVFRGSREPGLASLKDNVSSLLSKGELAPVKNGADWANNGAQGMGMESAYYRNAVGMGNILASSGQNIDIAGHSLGGGLASATSMASGKAGWTFNAAGLNSDTVEQYGGSVLGSTDNIQAYRVEGELLTKIQEVNLWEDLKTVKGHVPALILKEEISALSPNAAGIAHDLPGGTGSALDRHGIDQAINCIEQQKDEDISIIRSRL